jgi:hypothetical protein
VTVVAQYKVSAARLLPPDHGVVGLNGTPGHGCMCLMCSRSLSLCRHYKELITPPNNPTNCA